MKLYYFVPLLVVGLLLFGCTAQQPQVQNPTLAPSYAATQAPSATPTPEATATPTPNPTLRPGGAFVPESTPVPGEVISTPTVTPTPTPGPQVQEVQINASEWKFEPNTITVHKGITVRLIVQSLDQLHGIAVDGPNWAFRRELSKPDWNPATGRTDLYHPVTIEFIPYEIGEWRYYNSVTTFSSASQMYGTLHVVD